MARAMLCLGETTRTMNMSTLNPRLSQALLGLGLALAAGGCEQRTKVDGQLGELGRIEFTYARSCFFGCLVDQPLLAGTHETIRLEGESGSQPDITVKSADEDVAEVALDRQCYCEREDTTGRIDVALDGHCDDPWHMVCENKILVGALEPGDALIEVHSEDGSLIDRVEVHVKEAERARFFGRLPDELGENDGDSFSLAADSRLELRVELYDEDGIELLAPEGVTWRATDPDVATLNAFLIGAGEEVSAGRDILVETHAAGTTTVEVDVPGLLAEVEIEVE